MIKNLSSHQDKGIFMQKNRNILQPDKVFKHLKINAENTTSGDIAEFSNQSLLD